MKKKKQIKVDRANEPIYFEIEIGTHGSISSALKLHAYELEGNERKK